MNNKKLELTNYSSFSVLKSLDASIERIKILKNILNISENQELIKFIINNPNKLRQLLKEYYLTIGPRSLGINPTPYCNRNCTFCSSEQRNFINIKDKIELKKHTLEKLFNEFISLKGKGVVLVGGGEALLACDGKINEIVSKYNLQYGINTNGVNFDKFNNKKFLKKLSWVSLSIIGDNKELYNKVARLPKSSNQFYIVEENIIKLLDNIKNTKINVSAKIMICKENYLFAGRIYNYIKKLGFKDIALRCVNNFEPKREYRGRKLSYQDVELSLYQKNKLHNILIKETDLSLQEIENITGLNKKKIKTINYSRKTNICWNILLGLIANIDTDGCVYLCNPHLGEETFEIGNINNNSFKKIWASEKHIDIVLKTLIDSSKCDKSKCRHDRVNAMIDDFLYKDIKLSDRSLGDKLMSNFP